MRYKIGDYQLVVSFIMIGCTHFLHHFHYLFIFHNIMCIIILRIVHDEMEMYCTYDNCTPGGGYDLHCPNLHSMHNHGM